MKTPSQISVPIYADGSVVNLGDRIFIPSEQIQATVTELIQSSSEQSEWNVSEPGLMFNAQEFGLLFIPNQTLKENPLERL